MTDFLNSNDGTMHKVPLVNLQCPPTGSVELMVYVNLPWAGEYLILLLLPGPWTLATMPRIRLSIPFTFHCPSASSPHPKRWIFSASSITFIGHSTLSFSLSTCFPCLESVGVYHQEQFHLHDANISFQEDNLMAFLHSIYVSISPTLAWSFPDSAPVDTDGTRAPFS